MECSSLAKNLFKEKYSKELPKSSFLPLLEEYGEHLFAEAVMKAMQSDNPALAHFLRHLFIASREGHLCYITEETPPFIDPHFIIQEGNRYYLRKNWECEQEFVLLLKKLLLTPAKTITPLSLDKNLNEEQAQAIEKALSSPLTLICGGPGTGKTYTAKLLVECFFKNAAQKEVVVAAPTGKATANLRSHFKNDKICICTLQHLLSQGKKTHYLPYDLYVIDEGGMIDAFLFRDLFSLLKTGAQVVILGDSQQLPPVGVGAFFVDIALHLPQCVAYLNTSLRTEGEKIVTLIEKVKNNSPVPLSPLPSPKELVAQMINTLSLQENLPVEMLFSRYKKLRLLSAQRQGIYGVDFLNQKFYEMHKKYLGTRRWIPIIITDNAPKIGLYNGDFGFYSEEEEFAYFEGDQKLEKALLPSYEYGYLLSVHKSQGSEYDEVILLLPPGAEVFGKEMLYTAITRAKKGASLLGDLATYTKTLHNSAQRNSGLGEKIYVDAPLTGVSGTGAVAKS